MYKAINAGVVAPQGRVRGEQHTDISKDSCGMSLRPGVSRERSHHLNALCPGGTGCACLLTTRCGSLYRSDLS